MKLLENGTDPKEAIKDSTKTYGRFGEAVKVINPRKQ